VWLYFCSGRNGQIIQIRGGYNRQCVQSRMEQKCVFTMCHKSKEPFNEIIQQQVLNQQKEVTFYTVNNYIVELIAMGCCGEQKH